VTAKRVESLEEGGAMTKVFPTFLGIGVQRAATTWLYECLHEHPEIYMPEKKEIHFFDENYEKGMAWYSNFFVTDKTATAYGEITPNYINVPDALHRIAEMNPDICLFLILREPVSRAYSAYRLLHEQYGHLSFREACESTDYFLSLSRYADDLERLYSLFPDKHIKIFLYEDVQEQPEVLLRELFILLGVDADFIPSSINKVYNAIIMPGIQDALCKVGLGKILEQLKETPFGQKIKKLIISSSAKVNKKGNTEKEHKLIIEGVSPAYIDKLKEYFRNDILRVQRIINRDLSMWL